MYNESNGFVKIGVNDMMHNNNHQLMYSRMGIITSFDGKAYDAWCLVACFSDTTDSTTNELSASTRFYM